MLDEAVSCIDSVTGTVPPVTPPPVPRPRQPGKLRTGPSAESTGAKLPFSLGAFAVLLRRGGELLGASVRNCRPSIGVWVRRDGSHGVRVNSRLGDGRALKDKPLKGLV